MATDFLLNTDSVEAESAKIGQLSSSAEKALSSANSYEVTSADFDFSPAISAIKTNMQNIYDKVKVSSDILNKIVKIHMGLQTSTNDGSKSTTTTTTTTTTSASNISGNSTGGSSYKAMNSYSYNSSSSSTQSTATTQPTDTLTTTQTTQTTETGKASSSTPRKTDVYDYATMMRAGKIEIIPKDDIEEKTKDKTKLIIRINRNDPNYDKYIEMLYNVAKMYGIVVGIVFISDSAEDKTVSVALVKNGVEYGKVEGEITEEKIKSLFENAPEDIKKDYVTENEFVYYKQGDYKDPYAGETIAAAGCGPTSAAMVLTYLTGESVTPPETCSYSTQHGFASNGNGTYEALFPSIGKAYGLEVKQESQTATNIINSLKEGNVIIAHMGPGEFTKGGHYIVLREVDDNGNVLVADPANPARNKWYPASIFEQQRRGSMYSFSVPV